MFSTILFGLAQPLIAQDLQTAEQKRGSLTARNGFRNEDEIRDKFNAWRFDSDAQRWLAAMGHEVDTVTAVNASKPHGYKADVEVVVTTAEQTVTERISIKLVSNPRGFNQIDKRWLKAYAKMWQMPDDVVQAMRLYLGELPPTKPGRHKERMYLNELPPETQKKILQFFKEHKNEIVSDLIAGDGDHSANWFMVAFKSGDQPKWLIRSQADTVNFYREGPVVMTRAGNLKIGRVSMQRKGGDNGRETAKMLQFKMNPVELFEAD